MNEEAVRRVRGWLDAHCIERIFISRPENFAWLTAGGNNTVIAGEPVGYLEVGRSDLRIHTTRVESRRFAEEEAPGLPIDIYEWWESPQRGSPNDTEYDLTSLRLILSEEEQTRFRSLGSDAAAALGDVVRSAKPAWSEHEMAGATAENMMCLGIEPVVLLVAGERRVRRFRHPLPKHEPLGRLCMVVVCGRRRGLIINLTRMRSWGDQTASQNYEIILQVEAAALDTSQSGATVAQVLHAMQAVYETHGHEDALPQHHQGGIAGYRSREVLATPREVTQLDVGMAVSWNPSLPGVKVEDTFLLTDQALEILTNDPRWPMTTVRGRERPTILAS